MNRYKYIDLFLVSFVILFIVIYIVSNWNFENVLNHLFKITLALFVLCLFFYEKTKSFKLQLFPMTQNFVQKLESFFFPIFKFTSSIIKPIKIGQGIMIDISQLILITLILIFLIIL
jgi:hypothetical protein